MQSGRSSVLPQKRQHSSPTQHDTSQELSIRVRNNDVDMENITHNTSRVSRSPSSGEETETSVGIKFPQVIEEIYKLLPEDKFSRKENSSSALIPKPKSSIEEDIAKQESPSVSLPQSHLLVNTMNFIQDQMKKDHSPEDWVVQRKDMNSLVRTKFYQSHNKIKFLLLKKFLLIRTPISWICHFLAPHLFLYRIWILLKASWEIFFRFCLMQTSSLMRLIRVYV